MSPLKWTEHNTTIANKERTFCFSLSEKDRFSFSLYLCAFYLCFFIGDRSSSSSHSHTQCWWDGYVMAVLLRMAQPHNGNTNSTANQQLVLHDFLGMKPAADSPQTADVRFPEPSASASSAGGRGPFSATSDIASGACYFAIKKIKAKYFFKGALLVALEALIFLAFNLIHWCYLPSLSLSGVPFWWIRLVRSVFGSVASVVFVYFICFLFFPLFSRVFVTSFSDVF